MRDFQNCLESWETAKIMFILYSDFVPNFYGSFARNGTKTMLKPLVWELTALHRIKG